MRRRARAVDLVVGPGMQPDRHALTHVRRHLVDAPGADDEEPQPGRHVRDPRRRDVQHRQEDPEVEEAAAEVLGLEQDEDRHPPDHEQRAEILEPALREHLPLLA